MFYLAFSALFYYESTPSAIINLLICKDDACAEKIERYWIKLF